MGSVRSTFRASSEACLHDPGGCFCRPGQTALSTRFALPCRSYSMKLSLSWLKDHIDTNASLDEITNTLTRIGLEVEGVEDKAKALSPYTIARVVSAEQHPNADRLRVC